MRGRFPRVIVGSGLLVPESDGHPYQWVPEAEYLRCLTQYPADDGEALREIEKGFTVKTRGWSDHCAGLLSARAAIARGAWVIEVHVCLPQQARPLQRWEKSVQDLTTLRAWMDEGPVSRFVGRWCA